MSEQDRLDYYNEAMRLGLGSRLGKPFFTTVGKMRVTKHKVLQSNTILFVEG